MLEQNYWRHAAHVKKSERNKDASKRFYNPLDSDYTPKLNLYNGSTPQTSYNISTGGFPTYHHDYADHEN
tara:strand:- start:63 stop:272 length:210 start_codon:yes stop_codon:yes gene_type:complete